MGMTLGQRYANAIEQLLPQGWAWQRRGCDDSLLGRVVRAESEELARYHVWLEQSVKAAIERFESLPQGWSASDYERLLRDKFGISATVLPTTDPADPHMPDVDPRHVYRFVLELLEEAEYAKLAVDVRQYLRQYKQSHTDFWVKGPSQAFDVPTYWDTAAVLVGHGRPGMTLAGECHRPVSETHLATHGQFARHEPITFDGLSHRPVSETHIATHGSCAPELTVQADCHTATAVGVLVLAFAVFDVDSTLLTLPARRVLAGVELASVPQMPPPLIMPLVALISVITQE